VKYLSVLIFTFILSSGSLVAQTAKIDSSKIKAKPEKGIEIKKTEDEGSAGGLVMKLGTVLWGNLKQRLNVEGIKDNLEEKRDKVLGRKKQDEEEDADE